MNTITNKVPILKAFASAALVGDQRTLEYFNILFEVLFRDPNELTLHHALKVLRRLCEKFHNEDLIPVKQYRIYLKAVAPLVLHHNT